MDHTFIEQIANFITTIGFPIAMCLLVFWRMSKESEAHREEVKTLKDTIQENTVILGQLKQLIEDKL